MTRKDWSLPRFAPRSRHGRWSWSRMCGLALPRCRYEIVFKNAGQTAREYVRKAGDGKVCAPIAAAFNELEVHVLSPCFYYRYRSVRCFDGAELTQFALYIFKTIVLSAKLSLPIQAVLLQSVLCVSTLVYISTSVLLLGSKQYDGCDISSFGWVNFINNVRLEYRSSVRGETSSSSKLATSVHAR